MFDFFKPHYFWLTLETKYNPVWPNKKYGVSTKMEMYVFKNLLTDST